MSFIFKLLVGLLGLIVILIILAVGSTIGWSLGMVIPLAVAAYIVFRPKSERAAPNGDEETDDSEPELPGVGQILNGVNSTVEVTGSGIVIARQNLMGTLVYGTKGDKTLPFKSITTVQFKKPSRAVAGYIQFGLLGSIEGGRGIVQASGDENTVLFDLANYEAFRGLKRLVEERLAAGNSPEIDNTPSASQLATLASLYDRGHLSADEFAAEKKKVLAQ
ncbi:SHOCT domain-containing protein [Erythrobacter sp.]|nr:SHOCT domain-containing protein [Erythrobacter sp.]